MSDVANSYTMPRDACSLWLSRTDVLKSGHGVGMGPDKTFPDWLDPVQVLRLHQDGSQTGNRIFRILISEVDVGPKAERKFSDGQVQIMLRCSGKNLSRTSRGLRVIQFVGKKNNNIQLRFESGNKTIVMLELGIELERCFPACFQTFRELSSRIERQ